ncbi:MAG: TetR/AcrR family transcriptional regulator [Bacteriovoracaceae bacterium]
MNMHINENLKLKVPDTKERIIEVATGLFADRGFEGASIREIAKIAEVNLAAVNYHFSNKQNLYHEVLRTGFVRFNTQISNLAREKVRTTAEFSQALYEMLINNGPRLINNFKVLLNDFPFPPDLVQKDQAGPPGAEHLHAMLERELGKKLSEDDALWAVRIIFTFVTHTALMASTHYGKQNCCEAFGSKLVEQHLKRLVDSILLDLQTRTA